MLRNLRPATVTKLEQELVDYERTRQAAEEAASGAPKSVRDRMRATVAAIDAAMAEAPEAVAQMMRLRYMTAPRLTAEDAAERSGLGRRKAKRWRWIVLGGVADRLGEW